MPIRSGFTREPRSGSRLRIRELDHARAEQRDAVGIGAQLRAASNGGALDWGERRVHVLALHDDHRPRRPVRAARLAAGDAAGPRVGVPAVSGVPDRHGRPDDPELGGSPVVVRRGRRVPVREPEGLGDGRRRSRIASSRRRAPFSRTCCCSSVCSVWSTCPASRSGRRVGTPWLGFSTTSGVAPSRTDSWVCSWSAPCI